MTRVHYKVTSPTGVITEADWESNKNEEGVDVKINPLTGEVRFKVAKGGTSTEAIEAASASSMKAQDNVAAALGLVKDLAIKGATKGAVQ